MVKSKEKRVSNKILKLCSLYIVIWTVSPPLQHPFLFRVLVLSAGLLWLFLSWLKISSEKTDMHKLYLAVCSFCILAILFDWVIGNSFIDATIGLLQTIIMLLFILQYAYYAEKEPDFLKILTLAALFCLAIWQVRTLVEYQTNPGVSRLLVRSSEDAAMYAAMGVGGYGLVYSSVFSNAALMYLVGHSKSYKRFIYIALLVIGLLLVVSAGFLIALIMTLVSLGCWIIRMYNKRNTKTIILSGIFLVIFVFVAIELILNNSDSLIKALDGTFYQTKVKEIIKALQTDQVSGKLEGRTSRYIESIMGIFDYPIIGAKLLGAGSELGSHSTLLDMLGMYGLASFGYYYAIYYAFKLNYKNTKSKGYVIAILIVFVLNGVLNTLVGNHGILFLVVPGALMLTKTVEK